MEDAADAQSRFRRAAAELSLAADPSRCGLLLLLLESGEMKASEVGDARGCTQQSVQRGFALLAAGGLVAHRRSMKSVVYRLTERGRLVAAAVREAGMIAGRRPGEPRV